MDIPKLHGNYIDGEWYQGSGDIITSLNPATNNMLWTGNGVNLFELEQAIKSSHSAFKKWSKTSLDERIEILIALKSELLNHKKELALCISMENGKPLWEAEQEVNAVINKIEISIDSIKQRCPTKNKDYNEFISNVSYKPLGVFGVLGPFNFPAHLPFGHIFPALLAGNCIVFKPSELTPLVARKFIECMDNIGFPKGVINLVQGDKIIGEMLVSSKVNGILFVGSYSTGKHIHMQNAGNPSKMLVLEMGGNNPLVIGNTKDLQVAVNIALVSAYISSGQRCSCARRLIITESVDQEYFIELLTNKARKIKVATYDQTPEPFMGPLINKHAVEKVQERIELLVGLGAKIILKDDISRTNPNIIGPNIIDTSGINTPDEECFGPALEIIRVKDLNQAIEEANQTEYGLSSGIVTDIQDEFNTFRNTINAGVINWNMPLTGAVSGAPFGGVGKSGNFRPGAFFAADYCAYPYSGMYAKDKFNTIFPGLDIW